MKMTAKKGLAGLAVTKKLKDIADYDMDDALEVIGLRRRPSASARFLTGFGLVLGGVAVGAVLGMMLAPKAGKDLRQSLQGGMNRPSPAPGAYGAQPINVGSSGSGLS